MVKTSSYFTVVAALVSGCAFGESSAGRLVRDVRTGADGRLEVERCELTATERQVWLVFLVYSRVELRAEKCSRESR